MINITCFKEFREKNRLITKSIDNKFSREPGLAVLLGFRLPEP